MTRAMRLLLALAILIIPAAARGQDPAPPPPPPAPATPPEAGDRPTGLPKKVHWTFNFDAGWGTF